MPSSTKGIRYLGAGAGNDLATSFSDPLNVVPTGGGLGPNWIEMIKAPVNPIVSPFWGRTCSIGNTAFDGAKGAIITIAWDGVNSAQTSGRSCFIPMKQGVQQGLAGKQQFGQFTCLTSHNPSAGAICGLPNLSDLGLTCYDIDFITDLATTWRIRRWAQGVPTTLTSGTNAIADGTVVRASFDPTTTPGSVIVTLKIAGVTAGSFTDNTPNAVLNGGAVFISDFVATQLNNVEVRTWSCGQGL